MTTRRDDDPPQPNPSENGNGPSPRDEEKRPGEDSRSRHDTSATEGGDGPTGPDEEVDLYSQTLVDDNPAFLSEYRASMAGLNGAGSTPPPPPEQPRSILDDLDDDSHDETVGLPQDAEEADDPTDDTPEEQIATRHDDGPMWRSTVADLSAAAGRPDDADDGEGDFADTIADTGIPGADTEQREPDPFDMTISSGGGTGSVGDDTAIADEPDFDMTISSGSGSAGGEPDFDMTISAGGSSDAPQEDPDDPFAFTVIKADLAASHRGYGYDEEEDVEAPMPADLERCAIALVVEKDPDQRLSPRDPSASATTLFATDAGDSGSSASAHILTGASTSGAEYDGYVDEAAQPWPGATTTWGSTPSGQPLLAEALREELGNWSGEAHPGRPDEEESSVLSGDTGDDVDFTATASGDDEEVTRSVRLLPIPPPPPPGSARRGGGETAIRSRPGAGASNSAPAGSRDLAASGRPSFLGRRRAPGVPATADVTLREPAADQGTHTTTETGDSPASIPTADAPADVIDTFGQLQHELARLLGEARVMLGSEVLQGVDPSASQESHALHAVANVTRMLADRTTGLAAEADGLRSRYLHLRESFGRMHSAVRQAKAYQAQMLPRPPAKVPGMEFGVLYKPAEHVSGDFYDFVDLGDGRWGITLGDISGHGMAAAMIVAMAKKMLHIFLAQGMAPAEVLRQTNAYLMQDLPHGTFVTALVGVLDTNNLTLTLSRAGHPAPVLFNPVIRGKDPKLLHVGGMALGMANGTVFDRTLQTDTIVLERGDILVLFSDGVFELSNKRMQRFGMKRFLDLIREFGRSSVSYLLRKVHSNVQRFRAGTPQDDDLSVLAIKVAADESMIGTTVDDRPILPAGDDDSASIADPDDVTEA